MQPLRATDINTVVSPALYVPLAIPDKLIDHYRKAKKQDRLSEVENLIREIYFVIPPHTWLNPDLLMALAAVGTDDFTSKDWIRYLHPGGIPGIDQYNRVVRFVNGRESAWALAVHLIAYAKGSANNLGSKILLDPGFVQVHINGHAGQIKRLSQFKPGVWSSEPGFRLAVLAKLNEIAQI